MPNTIRRKLSFLFPMIETDNDFLYQLGKKIEKLYRAKYISQNKFAQEIGCDNRTVRRIIRGEQNVSILLLKNISRALDISLSDLLDF